jgi:hypothetical protein
MIKAVLFDLGDTLWHFPNMPPHIVIREETVRRINALLRTWGIDPEGGLLFLGRDIRLAVERVTEEAYRTDNVSPDYPDVCAEIAGSFGLRLTQEQTLALWDAWNLGGQFFGRTLFPDALEPCAGSRGGASSWAPSPTAPSAGRASWRSSRSTGWTASSAWCPSPPTWAT